MEEVGCVCEDYFGGLAKVVWNEDRWFCNLPGTYSPALWRIDGAPHVPMHDEVPERWVEVWLDSEDGLALYVMTRGQDEATNALAEGLAALFARFWRGKRED